MITNIILTIKVQSKVAQIFFKEKHPDDRNKRADLDTGSLEQTLNVLGHSWCGHAFWIRPTDVSVHDAAHINQTHNTI